MSRVKSILCLVRTQNLLTAVSDSWAGAAVTSAVSPGVQEWHYAALAVASLCLYASGAILNDLADIARDRILHAARALPSGHIKPSHAFVVVLLMLAVGILAAAVVGVTALAVATATAVAIVLYDWRAKVSPVPAAVTMAFIRFANFGLGLSVTAAAAIPYRVEILAIPLMTAMHVFTVTLASTLEETLQPADSHGAAGIGWGLPNGENMRDVTGAWVKATLGPAAGSFLSLLFLAVIDLTSIVVLYLLLPNQSGVAVALFLCGLWIAQSWVRTMFSIRRPVFRQTIGRHVANGVQALALMNGAIAVAYGQVTVGIALLVFFPIGLIMAEALGGA